VPQYLDTGVSPSFHWWSQNAETKWHRCSISVTPVSPPYSRWKPRCRVSKTPVLPSSMHRCIYAMPLEGEWYRVSKTPVLLNPIHRCLCQNAKKIKIQNHSDTGASNPLHRCHPFHRIPNTEHQRHRCLNTLTPVYLVRQNQTFALGWLTIGGSTCLKMCAKSWTKGISAWGKE
jgi:hypothetical protein